MALYKNRFLASAAILVVMASGIYPAYAADWNGGVSQDWSDAGNWVPSVVPGATDAVTIRTPDRISLTAPATVQSVFVNSSTEAFLDISGSGSLNVGSLIAGYDPNQKGTITVSGSDASVTSTFFTTGFGGDGDLFVSNGASFTTGSAILAQQANTVSNLTIEGLATTWVGGASGTTIGSSGNANFIVRGGAQAEDYAVNIGGHSTSTSTVTIDGAGTTWDVTGGSLIIGSMGTADTTVSNGAKVTTNSIVVLGNDSTGEGTLNLSGDGSSLTSNGYLSAGYAGTGTINLTDGATLKVKEALIGWTAPATGVVNMSGAETLWDASYVQIGIYGEGTSTVSDGATIKTSTSTGVIIAQEAGSKGTLNIGAAAGETANAAGNITAPRVYLGAGAAKLVFNHTDTNYTFSPYLAGGGTVEHLSGFTTFSGNSAAYTGTTNVSGGQAMVTGALGGVINVVDAGMLGGSGTVGRSGSAVSIGNGGILSPGLSNSVGTLTVAGNLNFANGSTYVAQILGNSSDSIAVTGGAVSIDSGSTLKIALSGPATAKNYTLVSASNITGYFSTIDWSGLSGYDISYDNGTVALTRFMENLTADPKLMAIANILESGNTTPGLLDKILALPQEQRDEILQQMSGETHSEVQTAFIQTTRAVNNTVGGRIRAVTDGVASPSVPALGYAEENKTAKDPRFAAFEEKAKGFDIGRFSIWANGFGSWGKVDGLGTSPDTNLSSGGMLIGGDALVTDDWRAGIFAGYSRSSFDTTGSSGDSNNYHAGVYAGTRWGDVAFRTGANYTWHDVDTARRISALGETLRGNYDSDSVNVFGELSYRVDMAPASFEPFASLAHTRIKTDGFTETGGLSALSVEGERTNTTFTTLGLRASADVDIGVVPSVIRGSVGWLHAFGDIDPSTTARFSAGDSFTVSGTPLDKDAALVQAGMDFTLSPISTLSLSYTGQFSETAYEHGANAKFQIRF